MATYVDGFVLPVLASRMADYKKMAKKAGKIWMEHGALAYQECVADDVPVGKVTSFPQAVKLKTDEVVVFSWICFRNRKHRNQINKAVMADPRVATMEGQAMPFDGKRMFWGGFKTMVEL